MFSIVEHCIPVFAKPVAVVGEANQLNEVGVPERRILVRDLLPVCRVHNFANLVKMLIVALKMAMTTTTTTMKRKVLKKIWENYQTILSCL